MDRNNVETLKDEEYSVESQDTPGSLDDFVIDDKPTRSTKPTADQGSGIPIHLGVSNSGHVSPN